ncbi:hypothetical protein KSF_058780 [Reticulibacter mediterranei]|uniref:Uncharacterized protein n=1 Tax=Reticulibacter mediterranei TaxID=2778369 RepID=A0A8J3N4Y9_9CHLR|nr:hypothetical protein KSF_058780 [Reticulibacter mediterranei]
MGSDQENRDAWTDCPVIRSEFRHSDQVSGALVDKAFNKGRAQRKEDQGEIDQKEPGGEVHMISPFR